MKPTHILIPIKDIEQKIISCNNFITIETRDKKLGWELIVAEFDKMKSFWTNILNNQKQISLDEKDIEETNYMPIAKKCAKMNNYATDNDTFLHGVIIGYKQALKDLI